MTTQQQKIAIAEACSNLFDVLDGRVYWGTRMEGDDDVDPLTDWNAMISAVMSLSEHDRNIFTLHLDIITRTHPGWFNKPPDLRAIEASLEDYAKAFLRTVGKWEES